MQGSERKGVRTVQGSLKAKRFKFDGNFIVVKNLFFQGSCAVEGAKKNVPKFIE